MKYQLSKIAPQRRITLDIQAINLSFTRMNDRFRAIRARSKNKMDQCYWCKHPFENGEMMALAFVESGNKALCQSCAQQAVESCQEGT